MTSTLDQDLALLRRFTTLTPQDQPPLFPPETLQQSLRRVILQSSWQTLGICAETAPQALDTLQQYLLGLGYSGSMAATPLYPDGPVYLKYNSQTQAYYLEGYQGCDRGVLITCQGEDPAMGTYGFFPLDLFVESHHGGVTA